MKEKEILFINDLTVKEIETKNQVLSNVTFDVKQNSCLGIFGPSGSGKTTLLTTIMRICHPSLQANGEISYLLENGQEQLIQTKGQTNKKIKLSHEFSYIPQNATEAFDPIEKIGTQLEETFLENQLDKEETNKRINILLKKMGLPKSVLMKYPFQLSGGTLQRCAIGLAIEMKTKVIIADEPTSALDSLNTRRVVDLLLESKQKNQTTILLATHNIAILDFLSDEVLVLVGGKKVEHKKTNPLDEDDQTYLGAIRNKKRKISGPFWRLKNEKMARD